jgi:uncharacterized protein (TIGR02145 family)
MKSITKLAATLTLATTLTLTACDEKQAADIKDSRDGKTYKTVKIGEQVWMAENLNYAAKGSKCGGTDILEEGEGILYYSLVEENTANCDKYGRLYDWKTAKSACPNGWHLPSNEEWETLITAVGGKETAGKYLKAKSGWKDYEEGTSCNGEDKYGFSALPGNNGYSSNGVFSTFYTSGNWWSSSEAYYRRMNSGDFVNSDNCGKCDDLFSVRCIKD